MTRATRLVAIATVAALAAGACSGESDDVFSKATRERYMGQCLAAANEPFCTCTLDEFKLRYTEDEFVKWTFETSDSQDVPAEYRQVLVDCLAHLDE